MKVSDTEEVIDVCTYSGVVNKELQVLSNGSANGKIYKIPRDENGNITGTSWELIRERMYDNLSKHYGIDLKTL